MSNVNETAQYDEVATVGMFAESAIAGNRTIPQLSKEIDQSGKVLDYCLAVSIQKDISLYFKLFGTS
jgi:ethanolamine transporter EutH